MECDLLEKCGFFRKYQEAQDMACRGFIKSFCKGAKMNECERKKYRLLNGLAPDDDMMPNGMMIPKNLI